jgi:hypothetical protein
VPFGPPNAVVVPSGSCVGNFGVGATAGSKLDVGSTVGTGTGNRDFFGGFLPMSWLGDGVGAAVSSLVGEADTVG